MSKPVQKPIANWGNYPIVEAEELTPIKVSDIQSFVQKKSTVLARGNERCYGDAGLNTYTISMKSLNRLVNFDRETGVITCEAGVLLSEILEVSVPAGFFLPVTPGTKFISVGGAVASDVHGKNHHVEGCFSEHVLSFKLINQSGDILNCSREENTEYFWETIGGMGLNGIILEVTFRLKKIESTYIKHESIKAKNLSNIFQLMDESESWTYTVCWIDCLQKGKKLGRSIMMRGEHAKLDELPEKLKKNPLALPNKLKLSVPFNFPNFALNTLTVKAFNFLYYHKQTKKHLKNIIDYDTFYYPLDAIHHWNRIYGKNGFIQYQFVIPKEKGEEGMYAILETIAKSGQGSFLAVLKLFGKNNPKAYNSFPIEGYTLALDFKVNPKLPQLVKDLDQIVEKYNGRIYRTKDAMSKASLSSYVKVNRQNKFNSEQNKRYQSKQNN